jgi:hypothetical protein
MALKNTASVAYFKVIDVTTGKGVPSLTVAGGAFTSIKLDQDNTLGSDIQGSITLVDKGNGRYAFALDAAAMNYGVVCPVVVMVNANYEAHGVVIYTETATRGADVIDGAITRDQTLKRLLSMAVGAVTKTGDAYAFKDQAGATLFTITIATDSRSVA